MNSRFDAFMTDMQRQYIITDEESFIIADVCEYSECNHEFLSKKHNIDNFIIYKSSWISSTETDTNYLRDELLQRFINVWEDVKRDEKTHSLSYESNDKTIITNIINEFKYFFKVE